MPGAILTFVHEPDDLDEIMSCRPAFKKFAPHLWIWKSPLGNVSVRGQWLSIGGYELCIYTADGSHAPQARANRLALDLHKHYSECSTLKWIVDGLTYLAD